MEALRKELEEQIAITRPVYVAISTRNMERAIRFYSRLFGFRIIERRYDNDAAHVLLSTHADAFIAIHEEHARAAPASGQARWSFVVAELDDARAALWNQGIVPVGESADASLGSDAERSLVIRDPDGHEIELAETEADSAAAARFERAACC